MYEWFHQSNLYTDYIHIINKTPLQTSNQKKNFIDAHKKKEPFLTYIYIYMQGYKVFFFYK